MLRGTWEENTWKGSVYLFAKLYLLEQFKRWNLLGLRPALSPSESFVHLVDGGFEALTLPAHRVLQRVGQTQWRCTSEQSASAQTRIYLLKSLQTDVCFDFQLDSHFTKHENTKLSCNWFFDSGIFKTPSKDSFSNSHLSSILEVSD